jgi:glycosyltransferase involved in cell wall biosynthesis
MFKRRQKTRAERLTRRETSYLWSADHLSRFGGTCVDQIPIADIWNLHSVFDLFDHEAFFSAIHSKTFVVWTLHQMNPLTGGCNYSQSCRRYEQSCGKCPYLLPSVRTQDASSRVLNAKKAMYERIPSGQLAIVTPSRWLADCAMKSSLLASRPVHVIPNGLDLNLFKPTDKTWARKLLHIPDHANVVLFVSQFNRTFHIKGFEYLEKGVSLLRQNPDLVCVSVGPATGETTIGGVPLIEAGAIEQQWMMPLIYSAADLLVVPSLEDNFPNVILEASACALPVIGSNAGGIPEMIDHEKTGLIVPRADAEAIANAIQKLFDHPEQRRQMGEAARIKIQNEFSVETQVKRYQELFLSGSHQWNQERQ